MNPRVEAKIKALCARTGLIMKQENGQRKYTNPALAGTKPEKGTEIFIGKLPRDLFEDELYPVLEQYGPWVIYYLKSSILLKSIPYSLSVLYK